MATNMSFINLILNASLIVQIVMLILVIASIASWSIIFNKNKLVKRIKSTSDDFESNFWAGGDLVSLYQSSKRNDNLKEGIASIFNAGFESFNRLSSKQTINRDKMVEECSRAMRIVQMREVDKLEQSLATLASIGSISPYVGLFGTVIGIMNSFRALSGVQSATLAMVAPGIAEALVATAMGLSLIHI